MKKTRIVIASVLKPVDDERMYFKMGDTLHQEGYAVMVMGYPPAGHLPKSGPQAVAHPHRFKRISLGRLMTRVPMFRTLARLRPEILIIDTHELLPLGLWMRLLFGVTLVYDIRENYYRNIRFSATFPPVIRDILALAVRLKEKIAAHFIHHFFLAERAYAFELGFLPKTRVTVLENKFDARWLERYPRTPSSGHRKLLFSGTLAPTTGVFEAIRMAEELHRLDPGIRLTIVGYAAQLAVLRKLENAITKADFIQLIGGDRLVPHERIIEEIAKSDFGLILYPPNAGTQGSLPTKLFEYMSYQLPVLASPGGAWAARIRDHNAGIVLEESRDAATLLELMKTTLFYPKPVAALTWQDQEPVLLQAIRHLAR